METSDILPGHCAATTSRRYRVPGVLSGIRGDMLMRLPLALYSLRISFGPASAADLKVSENIPNRKILKKKTFLKQIAYICY
jgi:hypothetical protein